VKASRPVFADKVVPEKVVRLFVIEFESSALIEASSLQLHVLSPQHDAGVAGSGSEPEALVDQPTPYSRPARRRFDEQQPQLRGELRIGGCAKHTADSVTVDLGDPRRLSLVVTSPRESGDDPCDEALMSNLF
jgi:hypothetical protein